MVLFRAVFVRTESRIDWRESYQITMAGLAATRLLAAGGAGGVALTAWALKRSGMNGRTVTQRMTAFLVILYGVYMAALFVDGVGLATGLFGVHAFTNEGLLDHSLHTVIINREGVLVANIEGNQFTATQLGDVTAGVLKTGVGGR